MTEEACHSFLGVLLRGKAAEIAAGSGHLDRAAFADWATRHRLAPWVFSQCTEETSDLKEALRDARRAETAAHLLRKVWAAELLDALRDRGVTAFAFKGAGLAHLIDVYSAPELRPMGDLDLLFRRNQIREAAAAAESCGFTLPSDDPKVREFVFQDYYNIGLRHPQHGLLELHQDLYRDIPSELTQRWLDRARDFTIYDRPVKMLRNPDLFLCLAVHFCLSQEIVLWVWLLDLALLGSVLTREDWQRVQQDAQASGLQVFVCTSLACLQRLWGVRPPHLSEEMVAALEGALAARERTEMAALLERLPAGPIDGDRLCMARRLSGRPVQGSHGLWSSLFCHPGAVCIERDVRSDAPFFWWQRVCHVFQRGARGIRAVVGKR